MQAGVQPGVQPGVQAGVQPGVQSVQSVQSGAAALQSAPQSTARPGLASAGLELGFAGGEQLDRAAAAAAAAAADDDDDDDDDDGPGAGSHGGGGGGGGGGAGAAREAKVSEAEAGQAAAEAAAQAAEAAGQAADAGEAPLLSAQLAALAASALSFAADADAEAASADADADADAASADGGDDDGGDDDGGDGDNGIGDDDGGDGDGDGGGDAGREESPAAAAVVRNEAGPSWLTLTLTPTITHPNPNLHPNPNQVLASISGAHVATHVDNASCGLWQAGTAEEASSNLCARPFTPKVVPQAWAAAAALCMGGPRVGHTYDVRHIVMALAVSPPTGHQLLRGVRRRRHPIHRHGARHARRPAGTPMLMLNP